MSDDLKLILKEIGKLDQKTDLMREDMKEMEGTLREEIKDGDRSVQVKTDDNNTLTLNGS